MPQRINRSSFRLSMCLLVGCFAISLGAPRANAADLVANTHQSSARDNDRATTVTPVEVHPATAEGSKGDGDVQQQSATNPQGSSPTSPTVAANPLTPHEKFKYFARSSFMPPMPYALSIGSGLFSEATDNDHHRHMTAGDFLADSMTHAARSMAFRTTANFFEKFAYATAFKQDPRYFRSDKKGFARIGYAVSRVFITQSDSGKNQFNASFLAGGLTAAAISNVWSREEDRTAGSTMTRFGLHVGYRALSNILKELFGKR